MTLVRRWPCADSAMLVRLPTGGETAEPEVVDMQAHTETGRRVALSLRPKNGRWSSIPSHLNNSSLHHLHITAAGRIHQQRAHAPVSSLRSPILRTAAGNHPTIRHPPAPLPPAPDLGPPSALRPFCCAVLRASSTSRCARDITRAVSLHQTSQLPQPHTFRSHRVHTFPCHRAHLAALPHVPACRGSSLCPPTCASYMALSSSSCTLGWRKPP